MELSVLNEAAVEAFVNSSPLMGKELERQAQRIVEKAKTNLSNPFIRGELNPPPGPPRLRTGDFRNSMQHTHATIGQDGLEVEVIATAVHQGHLYPRTLNDRGYLIISEQDLESLSELKGG